MSVKPLLRRRRVRNSNENQNRLDRLNRATIGVGAALVGVFSFLMIFGALMYASITAGLPAPDLLPNLLDPHNGELMQPTRIYDRSGEHLLLELAPQSVPRRYASINSQIPDHLPDTLIRATVALSDPDFWSEPGYRPDNLFNPDDHPTLAQSLVSKLILWDEPPGIRHSIRVQILAAQLTSLFGREKILEWYLNTANYGHYAIGADAAAQLYLGKPVSQLNLAEAALLVSVSQSPALNPIDAPQAALEREQQALNQIQLRKMASADEIDEARRTRLKFQAVSKQADIAPAFTALVLSQLQKNFKFERIEQGGLQVLTTLDYNLQIRANCALQTQMELLAKPNGEPPQTCEGAESLPPLPPGDGKSAPQAASAVVLDPRNGQLLALIGDSKPRNDPDFLTPHHPGTLLTPFIYLAGFTRGLSPASLVWDLPPVELDSGAGGGTYQGPLQLRSAITSDNLVIADQIFNQMGSSLVQQTMTPFGFDIPAANLKELIETRNPYTVIQVVRSYGVFAALGTLAGQAAPDGLDSSAVLAVRDLNGKDLADWSVPTSAQVVSPQLAYLLTDVLRSDFSDLGFPAAMRTGTTPDATETWAVGYTPLRAVVVWMGSDLPVTSSLSPSPAIGLWTSIMLSASRDLPPDDWTQPPGMLRLKVCDPSGMLPTDACPNVVDELFIDGFQPMEKDTLYKSFAVNRETGLLATVFTPPQLVENRVYMIAPPEAKAWAKSANLPVPPTQYDNIQPPAPSPTANITYPGMFAELHDKISISGTAGGTDFSYYRLQFGQGLYPETWTQIGTDMQNPVGNGILAEWDTTGLKGLYSLQLLVVRTDRSLQTATVQISLSNP